MTVSKSTWTNSNAAALITLSVTMKIRRPLLRRISYLLPCSAFVLSFAVAFAQTNSATPSKSNSVYAELAKAPQKATARPNPLAADSDAIPAGAKLFAQHCAECHGDMADGGKKGPSLLAPRGAAGDSRHAVLALKQRCGPPWYAGMVQAPGTPALAAS